MTAKPLAWEGCFNARDIGGKLVRADAIDGLTARGWAALLDYGVKTIIDLRNPEEYAADALPRPPQARRAKRLMLSGSAEGGPEVTTVRLPLDGNADREFWDIWETGPQFGTPLHYGPHLERFPERNAAVISAIARAEPGVVFHCAGGRDRTGQIAMLVLALAGVAAAEIAADYVLSYDCVTAKHAARAQPDEGIVLREFLAAKGTSAERIITELLATTDIEAVLLKGGATRDDFAAIRRRF